MACYRIWVSDLCLEGVKKCNEKKNVSVFVEMYHAHNFFLLWDLLSNSKLIVKNNVVRFMFALVMSLNLCNYRKNCGLES